jgi:glycosyltransferase involved in cell wall biosynthesis
MNVLIATGLYPPEIGGPATYALLLEDEFPKKGVKVAIVPFGWVRHYPKIIRHIVYAYKLWQESRDADVIYALDPISVGIPALVVATLRRKKFLIRLGGDYAWEQGRGRFGLTETLDEYLTGNLKRPLVTLQSFVTKRATKVVAPSEYLKSVIVKWGVKPANIVVIYSALYPLSVEGTKEEIHDQLSFTNPTIVSAGRLVPWKGFEVLIEVVAKLKEKYPEITLVIAGDGEEQDTLMAKAEAEDITPHVRFVGRISKDALGASIKGADVFVLNTAYEGLSHQLIEVMDLGTPIVTTTAGGNPELITNDVSGILVPFNDADALQTAIVRILEHPETSSRMVQSARARSREFSQAAMIEKIEAVLRQLIT